MKEYTAKLQILNQLSSEHFISGEQLGQHLGVSRAAVAKHIKGLIAWGVDIYSVHGKGYQLASKLQLLDKDSIPCKLNVPLNVFPVIGSTNQYLLDRIDDLICGEVCLAEYQAQGRGRRGRTWISPFGANLYLSMYWKLEAGMAAAIGLSLVVGIAVVEAFERVGIHGIKLKWPNDLYYDDKKLAGILIEMSGQAGGAAHLVIGVGLNIAMPGMIDGITQPWVSLADFAETLPDRNALASELINALHSTLLKYEQSGMSGIQSKWNPLDNFINRPVKLIMGQKEIKGMERGIDDHGAILIETDQGIESYVGGEISLRPQ